MTCSVAFVSAWISLTVALVASPGCGHARVRSVAAGDAPSAPAAVPASPVVLIRIVGEPEAVPLSPDVARALSDLFASPPTHTWRGRPNCAAGAYLFVGDRTIAQYANVYREIEGDLVRSWKNEISQATVYAMMPVDGQTPADVLARYERAVREAAATMATTRP